MDLLSDYYPFLEVNGKDAGFIFRELTTNEAYQNIDNESWKEAFINRFGTMLNEMPNIRAIANRILREGLLKRGININPEEVYVNTFSSSTVIGNKGVFHTQDSLAESYRLTDAALMNFFSENYSDSWHDLDGYSTIGIYSVGKEGMFEPSEPLYGNGWGPSAQVCIAKEPADVLYYSDLQAAYTAEYNAFWDKYSDMYRDMIADLFLASAIRQYKNKLLSEYGFAMLRKVYAKQAGVTTYMFNVDTYEATDIVVMVAKVSGRDHTILYLPGASIPFIEFDNFTQMRKWLMQHLGDPMSKAAFLKHFSIYVRQDGVAYSGVDTFINKMLNDIVAWNPQDYIMLRPTILLHNEVFNKIRDKTKAVMLDDANRRITSNSEVYRDYILNFFESLLSHLFVIDMLVPEIGIPLNAALSATTLGLSADIAVNGDTLQKRLDGVGSLVGSTIYTAINLIPIFMEVGATYKMFSRAANEIPAFVTEEKFMVAQFNLESTDTLKLLNPEHPPYTLYTHDGQIQVLVRLANGNKPLAVLRHVSGNMYVRLNPVTLEELQGEGLITKVLSEPSGKPVFVSNGKLLGGAPYNPYENFLGDVWTVDTLKKKADRLGFTDTKYIAIKDKLRAMHGSADFNTKQELAHELYSLLKDYEATYPRALRGNVLRELAIQIKDGLYEGNATPLGGVFLGPREKINYKVASKIYPIILSEQLGELPAGLTDTLIKFAKEDAILGVSGLSESFIGNIPTGLPFEVKYMMDDLSALNNLSTQYFRATEYINTTVKNNKEAFVYSLKESHRLGMLSRWTLAEDENKAYIGYSYEDLMRTVTDYSCNSSTKYSVHPINVKNMLLELLPGRSPRELMEKFGTAEYYDSLITKRIKSMEKTYQIKAESLFQKFDNDVQSVFHHGFKELTTVQERLDMLMNNTNGVIFSNGRQEFEYLNTHLDFFQSKGVTHIGVTEFFADLDQVELDEFLQDGTLTTHLGATILSVDMGEVNGPFYRLIMSAKNRGLKIIALGESDAVFRDSQNPYMNIYVKGMINRNAERMLKGTKFIVLANRALINTIPGIQEGAPGLAQQLKAPGIFFKSTDRVVNFMPDILVNRTAMTYARLPYDTSISLPPGRFLGWKKYGDGYTFVTPAQREASVFAKIEDDLEGFKAEFRDIRDRASNFQCAGALTCDRVTSKVQNALASAGKRMGKGRSLSWWIKDGDDFVNNVHTAASVYIRDKEYVVDASHLQFPHDLIDEGVMILPPDNWAQEILNRVKGSNPYMVDRSLIGNYLFALRLPNFTKPKVHKTLNQ